MIETASGYLEKPITRADVKATFAGLLRSSTRPRRVCRLHRRVSANTPSSPNSEHDHGDGAAGGRPTAEWLRNTPCWSRRCATL